MSSIPSLEAIRDWCNEKFTLKKASSNTLGGIKVGTGLSIDSITGVLSATGGGSYTLPPATQNSLGGIKVGSGLSVTQDGTLSATGGTIEYATSAQIQALFNNDYLNGDSSSVTF